MSFTDYASHHCMYEERFVEEVKLMRVFETQNYFISLVTGRCDVMSMTMGLWRKEEKDIFRFIVDTNNASTPVSDFYRILSHECDCIEEILNLLHIPAIIKIVT